MIRDIHGYWCIFNNTYSRTSRAEGGGGGAFFENRKRFPDFGKKDPDCVHLWFPIQNVVLRVSRRKNSKMLKPRLPEKYLVARLHSGIILLAKRSILNIWQCSEDVCLNNCSVICTVTLSYVLHQAYTEFWIIQNSVYSGVCRRIETYSALLRHIHAYWSISEQFIPILFNYIQSYSELCVVAAYAEIWHIWSIQNPPRIASQRIFRTLSNLGK